VDEVEVSGEREEHPWPGRKKNKVERGGRQGEPIYRPNDVRGKEKINVFRRISKKEKET